MLTLKDIKLAINDIILDKFPHIEIQASDVKEGFKRPSFFVHLDNIDRDARLYVAERNITVRIYFFPKDRYNYSLEILEVQDTLEQAFNLNFSVLDRVITINETRGQTIDGVLEFEFDFTFYENNHTPEDSPLIEELELDV